MVKCRLPSVFPNKFVLIRFHKVTGVRIFDSFWGNQAKLKMRNDVLLVKDAACTHLQLPNLRSFGGHLV
jgi:hypothetical protein